ncbi:MAG: hypothetical protein U1F54_11725 [Burkholderiales bacterium]
MKLPFAALIASSISGSLIAYEPETHQLMTRVALNQSFLGSVEANQVLSRLGLRMLAKEGHPFLNAKGERRYTIGSLVEDGAIYEDDGHRALNHFFNPLNGRGLMSTPSVPVWLAPLMDLEQSSSPDWALGSYNESVHYPSPQLHSYNDFKQYYFNFLTLQSAEDRRKAMGWMLQTLGHLVHHVQDMAQPQHVRNDPHVFDKAAEKDCENAIPAWDVLAYGKCRVYNALRNPSFYEGWTLQLTNEYGRTLQLDGYAPVFRATSENPFAKPREFWTTGAIGIADFTNINFVSQGTVDIAPPVQRNAITMTAGALCNGAQPKCGNIDPTSDVRFWPTEVNDHLVQATYPHPFAASWSIFTPDFVQYSVAESRAPKTVNRFTFEYDYLYLMPRAVGYSSGLINFIFRGVLDVDVPNQGVASAIDLQSCSRPCGFASVKLLIKNATARDDMGGGSLYLIAKFRPNKCFVEDLSGEDGGASFQGESTCRESTEWVTVSAPVKVAQIAREYGAPVTFTFGQSKQIPISASDLVLQVIYRGKLGLEEDGIAVSTLDVSEPNYVAVGNLTDYVFYDGDDKYAPLKTGDRPIVLNKVTFGFQDPALAQPLATLTGLTGGEHAQFAFITTKGARNYWLRTESTTPFPYTDNAPFRVEEFFKDDDVDGSAYSRTCQVVPERGRYRQYTMYYAQTAHGRVSAAVPGEAQPAALRQVDDRHLAKYANDCKGSVPAGTNGMFDFSYLTPYTNANAKPWTINFP